MHEIITQQDDLTIEVTDQPSADYLGLLRTVEFGSDALRYRRLDVEEHVRRLGNSFYFVIRREARAVGIFALTPCELLFDGQQIQSVYRSQLCVVDSERRRGLARLLRKSAIDWIRDKLSGQAFFTWGCVEENNTQVIALLTSQGVQRLGTLCSYLCYRQWPRASADVMRLETPPEHRPGPQLAMRTPPSSDLMIAGNTVTASVDSVAVELRHYGRTAELLYQYLLRFVGPARRRFNPSTFRYARLGNLECPRDDVQNLDALIHHSMTMCSTHYAVIIHDPRAVDGTMRRALGRFVQTTRIAVMAENFGVAPALISRIQEHVLRLAPMDI